MKQYKMDTWQGGIEITQKMLDSAEVSTILTPDDINLEILNTFFHTQPDIFTIRMQKIISVLANNNCKIDAIVFVRMLTNWGLKESRDYIESLIEKKEN